MSSARAPHLKKGSRIAVERRAARVTPRAQDVAAPARAEVERLMDQMREANEKLVVAAVQARDASDASRTEAVQARVELGALMRQLAEANERLAAAATEAHALANESAGREDEYRQLCNRLLTLQDDERRRLALELHDSTAQNLAVLIMNLALLARNEPALNAQSSQLLTESRSLADECSRDVRTRAFLLHPPLLEQAGLVSAVRWFADGFTKRSDIHVVMVLGDVGRLPRPIETALFRVVQESLTNVHRHASSSSVVIRLTTRGDTIALEIQDRGRGLADDQSEEQARRASQTLGVGIQGMRERIIQLNGTFDIQFTKKGTTVSVEVPLNRIGP